MLTIELRFLAGQFHATPWDHQVNEGAVEWPPAPWRLLRALMATWHLKLAVTIDRALLDRVLSRLASAPPVYRLPPATQAHTRHYMPLYDQGKTTKIFQAFVRVAPEDPVVVHWPSLTLDAEEHAALSLMLESLGYLGRAESWVEARVVDGLGEHTINCEPGAAEAPDQEQSRCLSPMPPLAYDRWRAEAQARIADRTLAEQRQKDAARGQAPRAELTKAQRRKIVEQVPASLADALGCDTTDLRKRGWSQPPGAMWLDYARPVLASHVTRRFAGAPPTRLTVARYAVASSVPPRFTEALFEAEKLHRSLVKHSDGHPVFTGSDAQQRPLTGHAHAFVLPESHDGQGHITHFTIHARMGFDDRARRALERVRRLRGHDGHHLQLVLLGIGAPADFAGSRHQAGQCPLLMKATVWQSRTPFVPTRHAKRRRTGEPKRDADGHWIGSPEHDLRRLLASQDLHPVAMEPIDATDLGKRTRWLAFRTRRKTGNGRRGHGHGYGFRITLEEAASGPIALGYGAHLGLGQFEPVS